MKEHPESEREKRLRLARRIVIKLGTSTVTGGTGAIAIERVAPIVDSIAGLRAEGRHVVLVSSGAVGLGAGRLGLASARTKDVVTRQACAAAGQSLLMNAYENLFSPHKINVAQILLTENDFTDRRRYTNLRRTTEKLLKLGVLPIINENDTVSTAELDYLTTSDANSRRVFSDNDRLAALVASKLDADVLVMLTDVDGLLSHDRDTPDGARKVIPLVEEITPELRALAAGPAAGGRGGMRTKLEAAEIIMRGGGTAIIANSRYADTLGRIFSGIQIGTTFIPRSRMKGKRRWIAYATHVRGRFIVNAGARDALMRGKASLLSSGVIGVEGDFGIADVVGIADAEGREFARGSANCTSRDAELTIAADSAPREPASEQTTRACVLVTRDNIVLLDTLGDETSANDDALIRKTER